MTYNLTNITDANNYYDIFYYTNQLTDGLLMTTILIATFLVVFVVMKNYDTRVVLIADSFLISVVASLTFFAQLSPWHVLVLPVIMLFGSIMYYLFSS